MNDEKQVEQIDKMIRELMTMKIKKDVTPRPQEVRPYMWHSWENARWLVPAIGMKIAKNVLIESENQQGFPLILH